MAVGVAAVVSLTKLGEAVNDAVVASLPFSVATRGFGALTAALVMATSLWSIGGAEDVLAALASAPADPGKPLLPQLR